MTPSAAPQAPGPPRDDAAARPDAEEWGAARSAVAELAREATEVVAKKEVRPEQFVVEMEIGVGAFGRVTKVRHSGSGGEYAMKAISKKVLRRKKISQQEWRLERDVLVHLEPHPYVVELVCAFQTAGHFFLVMKYLSGGELFDLLRSRGTFPEDVAGFYGAEVSLALEHLHAAGVIHRDLKPENLLLDGDGHAVVTDFGLAKMCESNEEVHRTLCGTDVYMAPEMVARRAYGKAVDFWSLGVLVYEMLTGKTPFVAPTTKDLHRKILTEKVKFPSYVDADAVSCLRGLLERQVPKRLGATKATMFQIGGLAALKAHAFFRAIEWQPLARRECPPPLKPTPLEARLGAKPPPSSKTLEMLADLSLDGASERPASDSSTVVDFEFCRAGVFDDDWDDLRRAFDSPTSSQCDLSSAGGATAAKKKKGPRKRKKKPPPATPTPPADDDDDYSEEPNTPSDRLTTASPDPTPHSSPPRRPRRRVPLESIPGSPHLPPAAGGDLHALDALDLGPALDAASLPPPPAVPDPTARLAPPPRPATPTDDDGSSRGSRRVLKPRR